jgi:hypothetical protein
MPDDRVTHLERELTYPEIEDLRALVTGARDALTLLSADASPDDIVQAISEAADGLRSLRLEDQKALEASIPFGALWGEQVNRALGWEWVWLTEADDQQYEYYAVVSPGREYYISAFFLLAHYVIGVKEDDTSVLLFNMLKAGNLPASRPRGYLELS